MTDRTCSIEGCERPLNACGWCGMHYRRWRKTGDPLATPRRGPALKPEAERFWSKVDKNGPNGCWVWTAGTLLGYGQFRGSAETYAHRWAYVALVGPIPEGLQLDHLCRNRACCNPAHLEPVTRKENILRGESPIAQNKRKMVCKNGHPLVPGNLTNRSNGVRQCATCHRAANRRSAERSKSQ